MSTEEATESVQMPSDAEIFAETTAPKATETEAKAEEKPEPAAEAKEDRPRDEKGRFAAKQEEQPAPTVEAQPEPKVEQPKEEKQEHAIPSWRLKEEADARREWQQKAEAAERERQRFAAELENLRRQIEANQPQPEPIDMFADPQAWQAQFDARIRQVQESMAQQYKQAIGNMSLQRASDKYGQTFQEAYDDIIQRPMDDPVRQQVLNSPDPGETLVRLYKQSQIAKQVGDEGLEAFIEKQKQQWLSDPSVLAAALEKAKETTGTQPSPVRIPPSINKATSAGSNNRSGSDDASVWSHTLR